MKIIKELSEMIEEELEGAENYVEKALHLKETHPTLARVFYEISNEEMRHVNLLHGEVVKLIEHHRKEHGEPPAAMLAVYDYLHEKHIGRANKIKMYQAQYRGE
jgi:bacterioferritin (cytochrome b1)